jgi:hypothetical protein
VLGRAFLKARRCFLAAPADGIPFRHGSDAAAGAIDDGPMRPLKGPSMNKMSEIRCHASRAGGRAITLSG